MVIVAGWFSGEEDVCRGLKRIWIFLHTVFFFLTNSKSSTGTALTAPSKRGPLIGFDGV
jgi:hypothetical protein